MQQWAGGRQFTSAMLMTLTLALTVLAVGCTAIRGPRGELETVSLEDESPVVLSTEYQTAVYRLSGKNQVTVVLSDLSAGALSAGEFDRGVVTCFEMFWWPKAGRTPLDPTSTNATIRQVIFADDAMGIYRGAGFLAPRSNRGEDKFVGSITIDLMSLDEQSGQFHDALGHSTMRGSFEARRDDALVEAITVRLNTEATRRLGRLHFVLGR